MLLKCCCKVLLSTRSTGSFTCSVQAVQVVSLFPVGDVTYRESDGVPVVVELLSRSTSASQQLQLLTIISNLATAGEDASAALVNASTASILLDVVSDSPLPRTQVNFPAQPSRGSAETVLTCRWQVIPPLLV
jgi:hypothetical protein